MFEAQKMDFMSDQLNLVNCLGYKSIPLLPIIDRPKFNQYI